MAACLAHTNESIAQLAFVFLTKYFVSVQSSIPTTVLHLFSGLASYPSGTRRHVMKTCIESFGRSCESDLVYLFSLSLQQNQDEDKMFVLSLLQPTKRSIDTLASALFPGIGKGLRGTKDLLQRPSFVSPEFEKLLLAHLSAGKALVTGTRFSMK